MWARLKSFATMVFRRSQWERDLRDEFEFHIEERAAVFERDGLSRVEAVRRARMEFRGIESVKDGCRDARGARWIDEISRNLTCAVRSIVKNPGFSAVAGVSLALGIGANIAVFGVLHKLVLSALPVRDPGQLYHIVIQQPARTAYEIPFPKFAVIRQNFDMFTAFGYGGFKRVVSAGDSPQEKFVVAVTGNFFDTLGVSPAAGRLFDIRDEKEAVRDAVVLSHAFWQSAFGGDLSAIGRTIDVSGQRYAVVGVTPPGFVGFEQGNPADLYLTLSGWERLEPFALTGPGNNWFHAIARLKPGVSIDAVKTLVRDRWAEFDEPNRRSFMKNARDVMLLVRATNGYSAVGQQFTPALLVLMGLVAAVFLIACANVATLLFVRGADRVREMSIRLALGASRRQLIGQWLTECMLLAIGGGVAGLVSARWVTDGLLLFVGESDRAWLRFEPTQTAALLTMPLTVAAGLICGLWPAVRATATTPDATLRAHGAAPVRRSVAARAVLAVQLAASLILVVGGMMFARTLWNLNTVDPGFDRHAVVYARPDFTGVPRERRAATVERVVERLRQSPLVASASVGDPPMLSAGAGWNFVFDVPGYTLSDGEDNTTWGSRAAPGYFAVLGLHMIAGRDFADADRPKLGDLPKVIIINQRMAHHYFSGRDAVGQYIKIHKSDGAAVQIIGVVSDLRSATLRSDRDEFFEPPPLGGWALVVARPKPGIAVAEVVALAREAFKEAASGVKVDIAPLEAAVQKTLGRDRLVARLSAAFAALGILLATIGLYASVAHAVSSRTREIGIRIAIGARVSDVTWMVLRQGLAVTGLGIAIGLPLAIVGSRLIRGLLFEVSPTDPLVLGASTLLLALSALAAGFWPARRAARLDPSQTLRFE